MAHTLPDLPFEKDALVPYISSETLEFHHDKHHRAYVDKLNQLIAQSNDPHLETLSLEQIILRAEKGPLFNNAAQAWNHSFYWKCLSPTQSAPTGELLDRIKREFGDLEGLKTKLLEAAVGQFGSGWAWLVRDTNGKLRVESTPNAENPITQGKTPLLTVDVWEHAYYIDYRNDRKAFVEASWELLNWKFAESNFRDAMTRAAAA